MNHKAYLLSSRKKKVSREKKKRNPISVWRQKIRGRGGNVEGERGQERKRCLPRAKPKVGPSHSRQREKRKRAGYGGKKKRKNAGEKKEVLEKGKPTPRPRSSEYGCTDREGGAMGGGEGRRLKLEKPFLDGQKS